jgi:hypothetical protein
MSFCVLNENCPLALICCFLVSLKLLSFDVLDMMVSGSGSSYLWIFGSGGFGSPIWFMTKLRYGLSP